MLYDGCTLVAVFINRDFTWSGVRLGMYSSISATDPLTMGAAMLVPLQNE